MYKQNVKADFLVSIKVETINEPLFIFLYVAFIITAILSFPLLFFEGKNILLLIVDDAVFK